MSKSITKKIKYATSRKNGDSEEKNLFSSSHLREKAFEEKMDKMKPIDMFFPIGRAREIQEKICFPDLLPEGKPLSPHVLTFRKNGNTEIPVSFPILETLPFQKKRILESEEKGIPVDIQMEKTKRVLGMGNDFFASQQLPKSRSSAFFRNLRNMFSLGIFFLASLLIISSSASAFYTVKDLKQNIKTSLETVLSEGVQKMRNGDFAGAKGTFQKAEQNLSNADFFFRSTATILPKPSDLLMPSMA